MEKYRYLTFVVPFKQLIRTAAIAVPVITCISLIMPLLIDEGFSERNPLPGILIISSIQIMLWLLNLSLLALFRNRVNEYFRYSLSMFSVFILMFTISIVLLKELQFNQRLVPVLVVLINNMAILMIIELVLSRSGQKKVLEDNFNLLKANIEAKHGQLLQQLKPHFLFNSLNTLRHLIHEDINKAEIYLIKLSKILRYSINAEKKDLISLREELFVCREYLDIQKIRYESSFHYHIQSVVHEDKCLVPIFCLQLLVENALKHNQTTISKPLHISISITKDNIIVSNTKNILETLEKSSGVGLLNLNERCLYLLNKSLHISEDECSFIVKVPYDHVK